MWAQCFSLNHGHFMGLSVSLSISLTVLSTTDNSCFSFPEFTLFKRQFPFVEYQYSSSSCSMVQSSEMARALHIWMTQVCLCLCFTGSWQGGETFMMWVGSQTVRGLMMMFCGYSRNVSATFMWLWIGSWLTCECFHMEDACSHNVHFYLFCRCCTISSSWCVTSALL